MALSRREFLGSVGALSASGLLGSRATAAEGVSRLAAILQKGGMGPPAELALKMYQERSGVNVVVTAIPWETQFQKVMMEFVGRSATYDIMPTFQNWRGAMYRFVEDLEPYVRKETIEPGAFVQTAWDAGKWKGVRLGLPFRLGIESLFYYRKDLYEKKGLSVPRTIDELLNNAEVLTSPKDNIYGFGCQLGGDPTTFLDLQGWHSPFGGRILKDPDQEEVAPFEPHGELMIKVVKAWKTMLDKGWMPRGVVTWGILDNLTAFQQGLIAQSTMFSGRCGLVEDPTKSKVAGKVGYALLFPDVPKKEQIGPRADNGSGWNIGMNKWISDERKEAAFKAIRFMIGKEAQIAVALKAANSPSRSDVISNPEFQKVYPAWKQFQDGLQAFHGGVVAPQQPRLSKDFSDKVASVLLGGERAETAIKAAWNDMEQLMARRSP